MKKLQTVDFLIHHKIQQQSATFLFAELSKSFKCRWVRPSDNIDNQADIGILIDHGAYHNTAKSKKGYKFLFHMSHDLADLNIYATEEMDNFDKIFLPTSTHYDFCIELGIAPSKIEVGGWLKYDSIQRENPPIEVIGFIEQGLKERTILYSPSWANTFEWRDLFPKLYKLNYNIVIKNHIYLEEGSGSESQYSYILGSVNEMEEEARKLGFFVAKRDLNICQLFPFIDILISDSSSCLLEFIPFGVSIETGLSGNSYCDIINYKPEASCYSEDVMLLPLHKLLSLLEIEEQFNKIVEIYLNNKSKSSFISYDINIFYSEKVAQKVLTHVEKNKPKIYNPKRYIKNKLKYLIKSRFLE